MDDEWERKMAEAEQPRLSEDWKEALDKPVKSDELKVAMRKGEGNKAPEKDGRGFEFFTATWGTLKDDMLAFSLRCSPTIISRYNRNRAL